MVGFNNRSERLIDTKFDSTRIENPTINICLQCGGSGYEVVMTLAWLTNGKDVVQGPNEQVRCRFCGGKY